MLKMYELICIIIILVIGVILSYQERGYFAFGGEWLTLLFIIIIPVIRDTFKSDTKS